MGETYIINPGTLTYVDLAEIFGKDAKRLLRACKNAFENWLSEGKYDREEWEKNRDRQFRIIYGVARRHGAYVEWNGTESPGQWTIHKHNEIIAHIYCL